MKNQMLILKGVGSSGKSTTTKAAFGMFLQWAIQKKKASTVHYLYLTGQEVAAVVEVEGETIGIATRGDTVAHVNHGLAFFASHRCKVVLCATRSKGPPLAVAQGFASGSLGVTPKELTKLKVKGAAAQQAANLNTSKQLTRWLKSACR